MVAGGIRLDIPKLLEPGLYVYRPGLSPKKLDSLEPLRPFLLLMFGGLAELLPLQFDFLAGFWRHKILK